MISGLAWAAEKLGEGWGELDIYSRSGSAGCMWGERAQKLDLLAGLDDS